MTPTDEQLIRTLTVLGCPEHTARALVPAQRDGALTIHRHLQAAIDGDAAAGALVTGLRTAFAFRFDLHAAPMPSSCDFDDDAVAREREAFAERRKQERP